MYTFRVSLYEVVNQSFTVVDVNIRVEHAWSISNVEKYQEFRYFGGEIVTVIATLRRRKDCGGISEDLGMSFDDFEVTK